MFNNNSLDEQETIINIDYKEGICYIYTSRKIVYEKIEKKLGKPNKIYYLKGKISGARWSLSFKDKKTITSILSRPILIGSMKC